MPGPFYFAWAGGTIQEQQTVVTTGNTHGGEIETITFVGDVEAGSQVMRLAQPGQFAADTYYTITGPGLPAAGAATIYNDAISAPGSLTLSVPATTSAQSATYTATKTQLLGTANANLVLGSAVVYLTGFAGTLDVGSSYGISGYGIGDAAAIPITTAYMTWYGTHGEMWIILVHSGTTTVETVPVTAIATDTFVVELTGPVNPDWYLIDNIPGAALASLTAGLIYNIAGNGIAPGTTFVAPASGATAIDLDQPTRAAIARSLLTITGPRTPNEAWNPEIHAVFDEDIFSIELTHGEGDFATLNIGLKNPGLGLLAAGRNLWCWLSWDQAWTPAGGAAPDLVPLFNGRLVGVPRLQAGEVVDLQFLARPDDFIVQKAALAENLQVLPYWDPVWLNANISVDTVLETYSALWHIDRVTLELSVSDILQGEAGTITIGEDKSIYDRFSLSYGDPPVAAVEVAGTVSWDQQATGMLDVTQTILDAFRDQAGAPYGRALASQTQSYSGGGLIQVLSGDGLLNSWPKAGSTIGAGWSLSTVEDSSGVPLCFAEEVTASNMGGGGGWFTEMNYDLSYASGLSQEALNIYEDPFGTHGNYNPYSDAVMQHLNRGKLVQVQVSFPVHTLKFRMVLDYKANRPRSETVRAVMVADVQRQLSDTAEQDRPSVELTSDLVGTGVEVGGGIPIGDLAYRSYFQTERGAKSLEYLFLAARAKIRAAARSVDVSFAVDWPTAVAIGLKHSVTLVDGRLPGGTCTGKVKSYTLRVADGVMLGEFTIGCTIGNGTVSTAATGMATYVESGYVEDGWQVMAGAQTQLLADEFAYERLDGFTIDDDGLDLTNLTEQSAVNYCTVQNGMLDQTQALDQFQGSVAPAGDPLTSMREMMTTVTLDLVALTGAEFHVDYYPALTQLRLPKTIDLAAG